MNNWDWGNATWVAEHDCGEICPGNWIPLIAITIIMGLTLYIILGYWQEWEDRKKVKP